MTKDYTNSRLSLEHVRELEDNQAMCITAYAMGYQAGRLHSLAKVADANVWGSTTVYALGYRHGWLVEGRPV